jgi:hypothetical protein
MGKTYAKNRVKIVTLKKWLIVQLNWKCYKHPPITPPNMDINVRTFEHHEPLFHTCHESLHQIDED